MTKILRAACVQFTSGPDIVQNLANISPLIAEAAAGGARLVITPENTCHMRGVMRDKLASSYVEGNHPAIPFFADLARAHGIYLLIGSIAVKIDTDRLANRAYLFAPDGSIMTRYDKIHLFDADLPGGETYRESACFAHGDQLAVADIDGIRLGFSICYDLRFPEMYRALAHAGAQIIVAPAAYAVTTGRDHWHTLVRARAIENGAFMLAPAQVGVHEGGRMTYGHTLAVDPWGRIMAERTDDSPGIVMVDLDMKAVENARAALPCLTHIRPFALTELI